VGHGEEVTVADRSEYWKIKLPGGSEYTLHRDEITVGVLRGWKQKFGPQYGKFMTFTQLLLEGDADAWCCAVHLVQKNAGENPKPPEFMDFAVGEVMLGAAEDEEAGPDPEREPDPTPAAPQGEPTDDGTTT